MAEWVKNINELNNIAGNPVTDIYIKVADLQKAYSEQGAEGVRTLLNQNGLNTFANAYSVSDGISADMVTTSQSVLISEESATGLTALNITNEIVDGVAYLKFSATPSSTYTESGSATTLMDFKDFAAMVLTATGLGWERMSDHPDYWNTVQARYKELGGSDKVAVEMRKTEDGTKIFANSKDVAATTKAMAEQGSYDVTTVITDDMPTVNVADLTLETGNQSMEGLYVCHEKFIELLRSIIDPADFMEHSDELIIHSLEMGANLVRSRFDDKMGFYTVTMDGGLVSYGGGYRSTALIRVYTWDPNEKPVGSYNATTGLFTIDSGTITETDISCNNQHNWAITAIGEYTHGSSIYIYNKAIKPMFEVYTTSSHYGYSLYWGRPFSSVTQTSGNVATPDYGGTAVPIITAQEAESETTGSISELLKDSYTDWYTKGYTKPSINPTAPGTLSEEEFIPLGTTTADPNKHGSNESTGTPTQGDITENGGKPVDTGNEHSNESVTTPSAEASTNAFNPYYPPSPNIGDKHPTVAYTGGKMFNAHLVTMSELDEIGGFFWDSNLLNEIIRFFNGDPLDSVIGCLEFYCDIPTSGTSPIYFGPIPVNKSYPNIFKRYFGLPCGGVTIPTYYNDARDYSPFAKAEIFLPFVGWQPLNIEDIIGSRVEVQYQIDAFTGACVASIWSNKGGSNKELYSFTGICGASVPLTGANHNELIASIINTTVGVAKGSALGVAGGVGSAISGIANIASSVSPTINRSGAFNGNSGAMSAKQPYIVITRKVAYDANSYNKFYGYPANITRTLGSVSGYTRVKEIHLDNIACTDDEKAELDRLLRAGIIL